MFYCFTLNMTRLRVIQDSS